MGKHAGAYRSEKRKKELSRLKKREEKRLKKLNRPAEGEGTELDEAAGAGESEPEGAESPSEEPSE